jgi:hypothetical protein
MRATLDLGRQGPEDVGTALLRRGTRFLEFSKRAVTWLARKSYRTLLATCDRFAGSRALAKRRLPTPGGGGGWLQEDERRFLEALSDAIIPSDEHGPGARDAKVVETLDRMLAASRSRQELYARVFTNFDRLSQKRHRRHFADLTAFERTELLREIECLGGAAAGDESRLGLVTLSLKLYRNVRTPVVRFFPAIVNDVMQAFYTHPVSWQWLGYDGPPMPRGYLDPTRPRSMTDGAP